MSKEIEYGSMKYYALIRLQAQLKSQDFGRLDLINLDRLRTGVNVRVEQIDYKQKHKNK